MKMKLVRNTRWVKLIAGATASGIFILLGVVMTSLYHSIFLQPGIAIMLTGMIAAFVSLEEYGSQFVPNRLARRR